MDKITIHKLKTDGSILDEKGRLWFGATHLTKKEVVILKYILLGLTSKLIARTLHLSSRTVEEYTDKIKRKLQCTHKYQIHMAVIKFGISSLLESEKPVVNTGS